MRTAQLVKGIRAFNRFYTNVIGVLERHILHTPYSLTEGRILYEIYHDPSSTARKIKNFLRVDEGYLSRVIDKLIGQGLITRRQSKRDGRSYVLSLTKKGVREFLLLNRRADAEVRVLIDGLSPAEKSELVWLARRMRQLLTQGEVNHVDHR